MTRPPLPEMLLRGLLRRCAWCGGRGAFFTGWTSKQAQCKTCGLNWRRGDVGYELGAAATAAIICMGPLVVLLGIVIAFTWPAVHIVPLFIVFGVGALVLPILLYPSSYTMWQAVDILMRPPRPADFDAVDDGAGSGVDGGTSPTRTSPR